MKKRILIVLGILIAAGAIGTGSGIIFTATVRVEIMIPLYMFPRSVFLPEWSQRQRIVLPEW